MDDDYFNSLPPFRYCAPRLDDIENVENYAPGGYHPVDIGDVISSGERDYEVVHKLGHGGCATIWLVRLGAQSPTYHALKILCADNDDYPDRELAIFEHLKAVASDGHPNVVDLQDSFKISGPNGLHQCLVFPVLGPCLQNIYRKTGISGAVRYDLCRQVASAMAYLHHHGVCHGDFTASNIVFELPSIQSMTLDDFFQLLGPIKSERLRLPKGQGQYSPHAPQHVVESPYFASVDYSSLTQVQIIDFGEAFFVDHPPKSLGTPIDFFPPELCFGYLPSSESDIWQLACVLYMIHTGCYIFPTGFRVYTSLVGIIAGCLGPIPQDWRGRFDFIKYGQYSMGKLQNSTDPEYWFADKKSDKTINGELTKRTPHLSTQQRNELAGLLHDMLAYEPGKRISAADVLRRLENGLHYKAADHLDAVHCLPAP